MADAGQMNIDVAVACLCPVQDQQQEVVWREEAVEHRELCVQQREEAVQTREDTVQGREESVQILEKALESRDQALLSREELLSMATADRETRWATREHLVELTCMALAERETRLVRAEDHVEELEEQCREHRRQMIDWKAGWQAELEKEHEGNVQKQTANLELQTSLQQRELAVQASEQLIRVQLAELLSKQQAFADQQAASPPMQLQQQPATRPAQFCSPEVALRAQGWPAHLPVPFLLGTMPPQAAAPPAPWAVPAPQPQAPQMPALQSQAPQLPASQPQAELQLPSQAPHGHLVCLCSAACFC